MRKEKVAPELTEYLFCGQPAAELHQHPLGNPFFAFVKRLFDVVFSLAAILVSSPVILAACLLIRLTTGESPIYRQQRVGMYLKPFTMYKLRTMRSVTGSGRWTQMNDSRRTRIGVLLRKFSIDELPQFINVLQGNMSVVGPRPEIAEFAEAFCTTIPRYTARHRVKPGITGWSQIHNLRGDTSLLKRVESDLFYIENWTLSLDLYIIFWTLLKGFYNPNE